MSILTAIKLALTDPHTSYETSCRRALEIIETAQNPEGRHPELDDPSAPALDYIGDLPPVFVREEDC